MDGRRPSINKKRGWRPPPGGRPQLRSPSATPILSSQVTPNRHFQHSPTMKALSRARPDKALQNSLRTGTHPDSNKADRQTDRLHAEPLNKIQPYARLQNRATTRAKRPRSGPTKTECHSQGQQPDRAILKATRQTRTETTLRANQTECHTQGQNRQTRSEKPSRINRQHRACLTCSLIARALLRVLFIAVIFFVSRLLAIPTYQSTPT